MPVVRSLTLRGHPTGFTHQWQIGVAQFRFPSALSGSVWNGVDVGSLGYLGVSRLAIDTYTIFTGNQSFKDHLMMLANHVLIGR